MKRFRIGQTPEAADDRTVVCAHGAGRGGRWWLRRHVGGGASGQAPARGDAARGRRRAGRTTARPHDRRTHLAAEPGHRDPARRAARPVPQVRAPDRARRRPRAGRRSGGTSSTTGRSSTCRSATGATSTKRSPRRLGEDRPGRRGSTRWPNRGTSCAAPSSSALLDGRDDLDRSTRRALAARRPLSPPRAQGPLRRPAARDRARRCPPRRSRADDSAGLRRRPALRRAELRTMAGRGRSARPGRRPRRPARGAGGRRPHRRPRRTRWWCRRVASPESSPRTTGSTPTSSSGVRPRGRHLCLSRAGLPAIPASRTLLTLDRHAPELPPDLLAHSDPPIHAWSDGVRPVDAGPPQRRGPGDRLGPGRRSGSRTTWWSGTTSPPPTSCASGTGAGRGRAGRPCSTAPAPARRNDTAARSFMAGAHAHPGGTIEEIGSATAAIAEAIGPAPR